ncbi:MAG: hypothetical protein JWM71_72 [Solirubrobacteraceae bacterium]|nr:hypothetical protein [Solirubrobacteraceae bacterium]
MTARLAVLTAALALALAPGASAAIFPVNGTYVGQDHITRPVDFNLHGTSLTNFSLRGNVILRNAHVSNGSFSTSENGVDVKGRWISDTTATGTITAGGSTVGWTVVHQGATWSPSSGTYLGSDGFGHEVRLSFSAGHARDFLAGGNGIFSSAPVTNRRFSITHGDVHVTGEWTSEHHVEGTIAYGQYHTTWEAHEFATR